MVIGNGLFAKRFELYKNDNQFLIFASGVSNSKTKNTEAYNRELTLLKECIQQHPDKTIVYFSTCSIYDPDEINSAYVKHKLHIEHVIQEEAAHHSIFRVSNAVGKSANPNTLLNYFYYHIKNEINFDLWINACRNIIDIDDVYFIADSLLKNNLKISHPVNIASPVSYPVKEIVSAIETFLNIKSNYTEVSKGSCFGIDLPDIHPILEKSGTKYNAEYLTELLSKYF